MEEYFTIMQESPLFTGIAPSSYPALLACIQGKVKKYPKQGVIFLAGDPVQSVGLVLSGKVQIFRENGEGKEAMLTELHPGELFGEVFACAGLEISPVTAQAASQAQVLHLNYRKIITSCASSCAFHHRLIENMLALLAQKNLMLNEKLELLSKRTTRERLLLFFRQCSDSTGSYTLPYSHETLAAYLCVDRSAMSAELSKLQKEGLLHRTGRRYQLG